MDSVQVQCPVPVKALMTGELRDELSIAEQSQLEDLERQLQLLDNFSVSEEDVFERQRHLLMRHAEVEARLARIANAPEGSEFLLRVVQATVNLKVGDNFIDCMHTEILLENGVVKAITRVSPLAFVEAEPEPVLASR